ncbi:TPA: hypothetical protein OKS25_004740 [Escherichia coli]|nr:hypothetical protein [Escherichia coli]MBV4686874.1 hypothetical protein [Escherichia coli]HAL6969847.1 hypothetical protein [Escherichia coli]HAW8383504.1 hypothetical protein [Escherichia coli]HCQ4237480.1 hypothetical protein [Escherichia coli]
MLCQGRIINPENDLNLKQTMAMGCWSEQKLVGEQCYRRRKAYQPTAIRAILAALRAL